MTAKQTKIRDFGEKVRYLIGKRVCEGLPVLHEDYPGNLPPEFMVFKNETAFAKWLGVDNSALVQWRSEARSCGFRLAPQLEQVKKVARQFGIWPKTDRDEDVLGYWLKCWPSWYSEEAADQFKKAYTRPRGGDGKPDSLNAFQGKRCSAALRICVAACQRIGYEPSHEADSAPF